MNSSKKTLNKKELESSSLTHLTVSLLIDDEASQKIRDESSDD